MVASGRYSDLDTIRHRPYLDKDCREILNRAARQIFDSRPDWVDNPSDPAISEVLQHIQSRHKTDADSADCGNDMIRFDAGLIIELFEAGLNAEEIVSWILWRYSGLDPSEIHHTKMGVNGSGIDGIERNALRNTKSKIQSAANKIGEDFVDSRSNYMYRPNKAEEQ